MYTYMPKSAEGGAMKGDGGEGDEKEQRNMALTKVCQPCHGMNMI